MMGLESWGMDELACPGAVKEGVRTLIRPAPLLNGASQGIRRQWEGLGLDGPRSLTVEATGRATNKGAWSTWSGLCGTRCASCQNQQPPKTASFQAGASKQLVPQRTNRATEC